MMRRVNRLLSSFRRGNYQPKVYKRQRSSLSGKMEKTLIRGMILSAVLLSIFQLRTITNPVDFYMKIAGDIDSPAFKYDQYVSDTKTNDQIRLITLTFKTEPENVPVAVYQHDKLLGIISKNQIIRVQPGSVTLDAEQIPYPVVVQIVLNNNPYSLNLDGNKQSFDVQLKP